VCLIKSGELASLKAHYQAFTAKDRCQISWKFLNNFESYSSERWLTFCVHGVQ